MNKERANKRQKRNPRINKRITKLSTENGSQEF